ncbi:hypothetical protein GIW73_22525 [Pseudomonas syringae]|uniref:Arginine/ornithine antiporter n=1 Tax=Pseudomonas syringae TaxID=317 RepID=A0A9Q3X6H1_PSESX|nr:hypothetical protein [Pseudomonas syringae]
MSQPAQKLRLSALIALVVGSMIGGGGFSLPQNMAARAEGGAGLILSLLPISQPPRQNLLFPLPFFSL